MVVMTPLMLDCVQMQQWEMGHSLYGCIIHVQTLGACMKGSFVDHNWFYEI